MRDPRHASKNETPPSPESWSEVDRELARRAGEGPFLGADPPDEYEDHVREGLERARLAGVFLDAPCFMAITRGPEHRVVTATPTIYGIVGHRRVLEAPFREIFPELAGDPYFELLDRCFESGEPFETGLEPIPLYADPDDPEAGSEQHWVSFAFHPLGSEDGRIEGVLITGVDATEKISERRALERRVRQQEALARLSAHALTHPGLDHLAPEAVRSAAAVLDVEAAALLAARAPGSAAPSALEVLAHVGPDEKPAELRAGDLPETTLLGASPGPSSSLRIRDGRDGVLADHPLSGDDGFASATLMAVRDPDGQGHAVLGVYSARPDDFDDTDLHFLEGLANTLAAAWRRHEIDRFQSTLIQNLPGMVYRCRHDRKWTIEYLSTGVRELTGYAAGELRENAVLSWADLIHPEDRDTVWQEVSRAVAEGVPFQLQYRIARRDGEERWVWEQGRAVEASDSPPRLEGYIFDVTESHAMQEELQEARSLLETTFRSIREAVLVVDAEGRTILACNPAVTQITGYDREELLGSSTEMLHVDREAYEEFERRSERALGRDGVFRGEFRLRRKDGCVIPTEHLVSDLDTEEVESPAAAVSVIRDLSNQKAREQEIRASRRQLQSLSRDLLRVREEERARISRNLHDVVGQTLTAAKFGLDALEDELEDGGPGQRLDRAREMVSQSLEQIRNLSVELRPSVLDDLGLLPAIRWYLDRVRDRADFGIQLSVETEVAGTSLSGEVEIQAFRIIQEALLNVARHADAARVRVDVGTDAGELVVVVVDDGRGFDPDRLRGSTPGEQQLGLLGMEERASLVGGTLSVESAPGEGTEVRFRAPLRSGITDGAVPAPPAAGDRERGP